MSGRARLTWLAVLALSASAAGVAVLESARGPSPLAAHAGRLGPAALGPAVSPAWSWRGVDVRREVPCPATASPIPGGVCYAADHGPAFP